MGVIISDLVNKNVTEGFSSHIDDYFSMVINSSVETNYTAYDYSEQSEAMKYIADSNEYVSRFVSVTGAYNENSLFVLDENFIKAVPEWLQIESPAESETERVTQATTEFIFPQ